MNNIEITRQLINAITTSENAVRLSEEEYIKKNSDQLRKNLLAISKSFSGSWLGYHSKVYYRNFEIPTPGDSFSIEWGLMHRYGNRSSSGWAETTDEAVRIAVMHNVDQDYKNRLIKITNVAKEACEEARSTLITLLHIFLEVSKTPFFEELNEELSKVQCFVAKEAMVSRMSPRGTVVSRDSNALTQGYRTPPHIELDAWHRSQFSPFESLAKIISIAYKIHKYMEMKKMLQFNSTGKGSKIFIGHGQSKVWKEVTYFLKNLDLDWDEFNREPTAGLTIKERLETMLDQAAFALLVMTSEDEHKNETFHARENVIHECGLFQGRLGFRRAIILLEEDCSEFSNIVGLIQIRFPKNKIGNCFEELRRVLEREGFLNTSSSEL